MAHETTEAYVARLLDLLGDDDPLAVLASTPARLAALVAPADAAVLAFTPEPSRWSIAEITAHLADAELVGGYRIRTVLATNGAPLQAYDQDRWAVTFDYRSSDARQSVELFSAYRRGTLRMLAGVAPDLLDNHGIHQERGRETIRHIVRLYAGHDRNHLAQIERLLAQAASRTSWNATAARE